MRLGEKTSWPGVYELVAGISYGIRVQVRDTCNRPRDARKRIHASSPEDAARRRDEFLAATGGKPPVPRLLVVDSGAGVVPRHRPVLLRDFATRWLAARKGVVDGTSYDTYEIALRLHIVPALGSRDLYELRPLELQAWLGSALAARRYSRVTVHGWFRVLRNLLRDAVVELDLPRDPTLRVRVPGGTVGTREGANAQPPAKIAALLAAYRRWFPQHFPLVSLLARTGLRFCQASAPRIADWNSTERTLRLGKKQYRGIVGPISRIKPGPKTLRLNVGLAAIIDDHLVWLRDNGCRTDADAPLFPNGAGHYRSPGALAASLRICLAESEISERFTVHGLRRSFHDLAREAGVSSLVVSNLVGHSTPSMIRDYSTVTPAEQENAQDRVAALLATSA